MSRPSLHVSTFNCRTVFNVWSPLSPFLHALSRLQVANAQCRTLRSLASLSSRSARKTEVRSMKKTSERKKTRWAVGKKCLVESCFRSQTKTPAKNAASQRKKFKAAEKTPYSSTKAPLQQKKCILDSGKKPSEAGKNPSEARKKPAEAEKKLAEKVQLCNPKSCCNGKNTFPQRKKQQPQS